MKKITLLAALMLSVSLAQAQDTVIRHSVEAAQRLYGDYWWGSTQSGDAAAYEVAFGSSTASVAGWATPGHLWGQGSVLAKAPALATAYAQAWVDDNSVYDWITIHSSSLPVGTPVMLEVTLDLWSRQLDAGANQGVTAWVSCGFSRSGFINILAEGVARQSQTGTCAAAVGQTLELRGVLYGRSTANAYDGAQQLRSFEAEARYSLHLATEGASFSSASGAQYLMQPVLEPASMVLMMGGLAALGLWRRRARR